MKKQAHWLAGFMATMTVLAAGCGGVAEKPAVQASPTVPPAAVAPAEPEASKSPAAPPVAPPATPVTPPLVTTPAPPVVAPPQEPSPPVLPAPPSSPTVTPIPESALPASLAAWRDSTVQVPNGVGQYAEGALYLMVSGGQRNSGGYAVEIRSVSHSGSAIRVSAVLHQPKPGSMVTQAITYPRAYARVNLTGTGAVQVIVDWQ